YDPAGEYEFQDTVYTLTVWTPPRAPPKYLPKFLSRESVDTTYGRSLATYPVIRHEKKDHTSEFGIWNLKHLESKTIKIKSTYFDLDMRCEHVLKSRHDARECKQGCYVLEKGGKDYTHRKCKRADCEGHVYVDPIKEDEKGRACFGKKGERL
ncbi:hypothetical protein BDV95DRAFT_472041, partial [Massariosphaeria phaeospora]